MANIAAKTYQDELDRIKENVQNSYDWFRENYERYNNSREFLFRSTLDVKQKAVLSQLNKPQIEFNILNAYVSRLLGEFSKQEPSVEVSADDLMANGPSPQVDQIISVVEGHLRHELLESQKNGDGYNTYKDMLSGGFSVNKIYTEYENNNSFKQVIKMQRVDAILCGFDSMAREPHKGDGRYCFEIFPKTKEEFEIEYPKIDITQLNFTRNVIANLGDFSFNWQYSDGKNKILLICDYYEKSNKRVKIVQLSDGNIMTNDKYKELVDEINTSGMLRQAPEIVSSRYINKETICRYRIIGNQVIEYVETDFKYLPLVFFDGDSIFLRDSVNKECKQFTKPYFYHAIGAQKLRDMVGQTLANEIENMVTHKFKVPLEGIPPQYQDAYTNVQVPNVLIYNAYKDNDPNKPLPPPAEIPRVPLPPEVMGTFSMTDQMTQSILGSYDASLGINDNQLSGIAIVEGATQSNAAAMPYIVGYLHSLNRIAEHYLDLIPKYYVTPRTMPIINKEGKREVKMVNAPNGVRLNYQEGMLGVKVTAGVNFSVQKSRALTQVIGLAQAMPIFAQFMNTVGLPVLLDNLEIRGVDHLKTLSQQFQQQMQQQQAQQSQQQQANPLVMRAQNEQAKIAQNAQQNQMENQLKVAELAIAKQDSDNERLKLMAEMQDNQMQRDVEREKLQTERSGQAIDRAAKEADIATKTLDMKHNHAKEIHGMIKDTLNAGQTPQNLNEKNNLT